MFVSAHRRAGACNGRLEGLVRKKPVLGNMVRKRGLGRVTRNASEAHLDGVAAYGSGLDAQEESVEFC